MHRGRSYKGTDLVEDEGLSFLNLKCIERDGGFRLDGIKRYKGIFKDTQSAQPGDIIMGVTDMTQERRLVARAARVPDTGESVFVYSMDLVKISPEEGVPNEYVYGMLRFSGFPDEVKQHANGANVLHLNPTRIETFVFPLPPARLRSCYADVVAAMYQECDLLARKAMNLRRTRDLLLPKLINGMINVDEPDEGSKQQHR